MLEPGIHTIDSSVYHADTLCPEPSLSASIICKLIDDSPAHAKAAHPRLVDNPTFEESAIMDIGSIAHGLILEGIDRAVIMKGIDPKTDMPMFFADYRTNAAKAARDAARARGLYPVLQHQEAGVRAMVAKLRADLKRHRQASNMFTKGKPEQTLVWFDEEFRIWCRARLDWLHDNHLFIDDYKSTGATANPNMLSRTLFSGGWDIKGVFYMRGLKALTGKEAEFRFAVQETYPTYETSVIGLNPEIIMTAEKAVWRAMETWRACLDTGVWPGYPDQICYPIMPKYIEDARLRQETGDGGW